MNTQHTSGPWNRNIRAGGKYPVIYSGRNNHVALVLKADPDEMEANIDLISAAPDLLAAAQAMADSFADCVKTELALSEFPALAALVAAIAKAKGQ